MWRKLGQYKLCVRSFENFALTNAKLVKAQKNENEVPDKKAVFFLRKGLLFCRVTQFFWPFLFWNWLQADIQIDMGSYFPYVSPLCSVWIVDYNRNFDFDFLKYDPYTLQESFHSF